MIFINNVPLTANYVQATVLNAVGDKKSLSSTRIKSAGAKRKVLICAIGQAVESADTVAPGARRARILNSKLGGTLEKRFPNLTACRTNWGA